MLFDITKARNKQGHHHKDEEALKRAKARSSKLKKSRGGGERSIAEIRPTLKEELERFKAIARNILKHDANEIQAGWFNMETRCQHRRLADLGVYGHQPAVAAYIKLSKEEKHAVTEAIMQQQIGANSTSATAIKELSKRKAEGEEGESIKIKIARIALGTTIKWKRTVNDEEAVTVSKEDEERKIPRYSSRMIACNKCGRAQETKAIQLRTTDGYRGICCTTCGTQDRCALSKCQCNKIWHQCEIHRMDPAIHASRRGITKNKDDKAEEKEKIKLCSHRKAPKIKASKLNKHIKKKNRRQHKDKAQEEKRYVKFVASSQPPKAGLIAKIRMKMTQSDKRSESTKGMLDKIEARKIDNLDKVVKNPEEATSKQPATRDALKRRLNACIRNRRIQKDKEEGKPSTGSKAGKSKSSTKPLVRHAGIRPKASSDAIARLLSVT